MTDREAIDLIINEHSNPNRAARAMGLDRQLLVFWRNKAAKGELPDSGRVAICREGVRLKLPGFNLAFVLRSAE
jgi:hypothetical protein